MSNDSADRQIYFDLFGYHVLNQNRLISGLSHIHLEDVLQYVALPQVRIEVDERPSTTPKTGKVLPKSGAKGRSDLKLLFSHLKDEKKVKTILKVIVDDLQEPAHSDEAIEACLKDTEVEIWDWRKMDLCVDVIQNVAPGVREVHLYWSGNNAVLRGWGEAEGLPRLQRLEKICLHYQEVRARRRDFRLLGYRLLTLRPIHTGARVARANPRVCQCVQRTNPEEQTTN